MALHLTSAAPIREPGFSRSECLELARRIESGELWTYECECGADVQRDCSGGDMALIVAALRAYADV